jgi:hypothetical protein
MTGTIPGFTAVAFALVVLPAAAQDKATGNAIEAGSSSYRSAFTGYRGFGDLPVVSWREANDRVREIGGWKAYAREAQSPASEPPAASGASAGNPHAKHHK